MKSVPFSCPHCNVNAPTQPGGSTRVSTGMRRVRECPQCGLRFSTYQPPQGVETFGLALAVKRRPVTNSAAIRALRKALYYEIGTDIELLGHITRPTRELAQKLATLKGA